MSTEDNADDYDDLESAIRIILILDYGKEPRRIKNIFASHTLGRILIAATLASDYGRQIVIGERISQTKPLECILRTNVVSLHIDTCTATKNTVPDQGAYY
ncbi:Cytochrome P450 26B1 [Trichinella spiralis]|uniref:Cytochrome P450 26B1 n=1 Tax=Trichinella spiralis TaxID=6334 RepID=A0ABR3KMN1_TRISP